MLYFTNCITKHFTNKRSFQDLLLVKEVLDRTSVFTSNTFCNLISEMSCALAQLIEQGKVVCPHNLLITNNIDMINT